MAQIDFNPFGTKFVFLKLMCDNCSHEVISEEIAVPTPDYLAETAHDSYSDNDGYATCPNCDKSFDITVWASYADGYIDISDIEDENIVDVIEIQEANLDEYYEEQIQTYLFNSNSLDIFNREILNIEKLNDMNVGNKNLEITLKRQLYSGIVTCMEDYLSDKLINSVLKNNELFKRFVKTFHGIRDRKFSLNEIFEKQEQLVNIVKKELLDIIYHDLPKVKGMYEDTFQISFPKFGEIIKIVSQRHDMVHRNGKTKEGYTIGIDKEKITETATKIKEFVHAIDILTVVQFDKEEYC